MRSSERQIKKIPAFLTCVVLFAFVCFALDFALYPCTYVRNDVHTVTSEYHDAIFLGTSNGKMNIDPDVALSGRGLTGHNLCNGNQYPIDSFYLAKLLVKKQKPAVVVYEADPAVFVQQKEPGNNYLLFYHEFPASVAKAQYFFAAVSGLDLRAGLFPFYEYPLSTSLARLRNTVYQKATRNYDVSYLKGAAAEYHENGWMERYPVAAEDFPAMSARAFSAQSVNEENMRYLDRLVRLCADNDIALIAVTLPQADATLEAFSDAYAAAGDFFEEYFTSCGVSYYNFNDAYYDVFPHDAARYVDYNGHMNGESAKAFSAVFGETVFGDWKP